jgi:hypothetical protein
MLVDIAGYTIDLTLPKPAHFKREHILDTCIVNLGNWQATKCFDEYLTYITTRHIPSMLYP